MMIDTNIYNYYTSSVGNGYNNSYLQNLIADKLNYAEGLLRKEIFDPPKVKVAKAEAKFVIKKVIFSDPATIVLWEDGTKTIVKTQKGDVYDPEKGLAVACMRKILSKKDYHKWLEEARVKNIPINEEVRLNGV